MPSSPPTAIPNGIAIPTAKDLLTWVPGARDERSIADQALSLEASPNR